MLPLPNLVRGVADATLATLEGAMYKTDVLLLQFENGRSLLSEWISLLCCIMAHLRPERIFAALVSLFLAASAQDSWDHALFESSPPVYPSREFKEERRYMYDSANMAQLLLAEQDGRPHSQEQTCLFQT